MRLETYVKLALVGFAVFIAFRYQGMGKEIVRQRAEFSDTLASLVMTRNRLVRSDRRNVKLTTDSATLTGKVNDLVAANLKVRAEAAEARTDVQGSAIAVVAPLNAVEKKKAADKPAGGIGEVATTVNDSVANGQFAVLKEQVDKYGKVIVPGLLGERLSYQLRADEAEAYADRRGREADAAYSSSADRIERETDKKRFLNIGLKKAVRRGVADIRAGRVKP